MTTSATRHIRESDASAGRIDLLLFTDVFPSGSGEAFLEPEIASLARAFARVVVVPRRALPTARVLPDGVYVDYSLAELHRERTRASSLIACLGSAALYRELLRRPGLSLRPHSADALVGQLAEALRTRRWLEQRFGSGDLDASRTLVYSYWLWSATIGAGITREVRHGPGIVSRAHGFDVYAERHRHGYVPLQDLAIGSSNAVFTVSEHGREYLARRYPGLAQRISVSRLGTAEPDAMNRPSVDGVFRVLTCARVEEVKRLDRVVVALSAFGTSHPGRRVQWTHFGSGSGETGLRGMAEQLLPETVEWSMRGEVPNSEVRRHYATMPVDVLLSLSSSEGVPVSMMEAQSFGVPIVATSVGGVPEIVAPGTGVLLPPDAAPHQVGAALAEFIPGATGVATMRARSRESWEQRYRAELNLERFVDELVRLGSARGRV